MASSPAVAIESRPTSIAESTVVLNLELGRISNRKKIDSRSTVVETDVDRSMLHLSKDLFDAAELRACITYLNALKARIRQKTVPSFLRGGMYLVNVLAVEEVDQLIEVSRTEFRPIVQAFADVVDDRRDQSKERLGSAYNEADYPTRAQVLDAFTINHSWLTLGTPSSLRHINRAIFEREREKAEANLKTATEEITRLLAAEAKQLADHMIERLTPDAETGKPKVFRNTIVSNVSEFLANFNLRNVGSSEELSGQVERIRGLLDGVTPDTLRTSDRLREDVAAGFDQVAKALDKLVMAKPSRFIDTEELS